VYGVEINGELSGSNIKSIKKRIKIMRKIIMKKDMYNNLELEKNGKILKLNNILNNVSEKKRINVKKVIDVWERRVKMNEKKYK
jgi:hypothetical protein